MKIKVFDKQRGENGNLLSLLRRLLAHKRPWGAQNYLHGARYPSFHEHTERPHQMPELGFPETMRMRGYSDDRTGVV